MKKSTFFTAITFVFMTLLSFSVNAQNFSDLDKSPMDVASFPTSYKESNKLVKVTYSRPQLKGRDLGTLAPNGKVWRTGANEAAEITLYSDMELGGTTVKAGTYSLFTIPGDKEWSIILSSDLNVWGSYFYKKANDVARIIVPVKEGKKSIEAFSMAFEKSDKGLNLHMGWGTLRVSVPFGM